MKKVYDSLGFEPLNRDDPVLVIGAAGVDIVGRMQGDLQPGTSIASHIRNSFGGVGRNVAENLARLGQEVVLVTAVGQDHAGDQLLEQAAQAGVDVNHVVRASEQPTGSYVAILNQAGQLQFALDDMRAITSLTPEHISGCEELFWQASLVFFDANLTKDTLNTVVSMAKKARLPIVADPTSASLAPRLLKFLPEIFLLTPNHSEASVLSGKEIDPSSRRQTVEAAKTLVSRGVKMAVVTLAEHGLCYATSETSGHISALRTRVVDPTGAGDALSATLIFALLNEISIDDAVRLAVTSATLTLNHRGAVVPDLTLEKLYDRLMI